MGEALKWEGSSGEWENLIMVSPSIIKDCACLFKGFGNGCISLCEQTWGREKLGSLWWASESVMK